jgi:hypothetical protein
MLARILLYIKHNFKFLWRIFEWVNGLMFTLFYGRKLVTITSRVILDFSPVSYRISVLNETDLLHLEQFLEKQPAESLRYFDPHGFDYKSLEKTLHNPAFLMMGVFYENSIVGYFFLRFFFNRKCFVGRLVGNDFQGKGIGKEMNAIMYNIAWRMKFHCLSTISMKNNAVMTAHSKNNTMVILKELGNDYILVEFKEPRGARGTGLRAQSIEHGARSKALGNQ